MKKNTKGAIALGAAALLLAGGAGTMAAWSDSASLDGGTVTSGDLRITEVDNTGGWTWGTEGSEGDPFDPDNDFIVPGDVIEYTAEYDIEMSGQNLVASLTSNLGGVSGDLASYLDVNTTSSTGDIARITPADTTDPILVTTVITFQPGTEAEESMDATATLAGSTITLQQIEPAGPADNAG